MGLGLEVGILADLKEADDEGFAYCLEQFEIVSKVLRAEGLEEHIEPQELDGVFSCGMFGYAGLHYLRRVAIHMALGKATPPPGTRDAHMEPALNQEYWDRFQRGEVLKYQHLIIHSDAEGFYVPVDFERPLVVTNLQLAGGMLGSTQRLQAECRDLAGILGMPVDMDHEADEIYKAIDNQGEGRSTWQQYGVETFTCLRLLAACAASLRTKAAIAFV